MCSVKLEVEEDAEAYVEGGDNFDHGYEDAEWGDGDPDYELPFPGRGVNFGMSPALLEAKSIFKCELCGKKFARKSNYTRHMYLHREAAKAGGAPGAALEIKEEEANLAEHDDPGGKVQSNGKQDASGKKKRGPYKSRQQPPPGKFPSRSGLVHFQGIHFNLDIVLNRGLLLGSRTTVPYDSLS